eukprot:Phypoly_transcript_06220.p1 GENE.Phypoly_transcript_06220~~Phypoly_transcript_06220.p1  ORF type:complete len:416 (+),score=35.23 Phypoly_transcript_06220:252-1499(+)
MMLGSAGGYQTSSGYSSAGGGAIYIGAGTFNSSGQIIMDGTQHSYFDARLASGGSGGSIFIVCEDLVSIGTLSVNGAPKASAGRIAIHYVSGSPPDILSSVTIPASGSGSPASVYVHAGSINEIYALGYTYTDFDGYKSIKLYIADYGATVYSNSSQQFKFSRIHVAATARLIFPNVQDTLQIDGTTRITGTGPIIVAGTLDAKDQAIANSTSPIAVLATGTAQVNPTLLVRNADFMALGHLVPSDPGPMNIDASSKQSGSLVEVSIGAKGTNTNTPGAYTFGSITLADAVLAIYSDVQTATGVNIAADLLLMTGASSVSASGRGFPCGQGDGTGVASFDYNFPLFSYSFTPFLFFRSFHLGVYPCITKDTASCFSETNLRNCAPTCNFSVAPIFERGRCKSTATGNPLFLVYIL